MVKKLALILHYKCNNNCRFCYCADKKDFGFLNFEDARRELEQGKSRDFDFVDFSGGEPTLRKDLPKLINYAKKLGYGTRAITTNGRLLYYKSFTKKLVDSGLNHVVFSLHGHNKDLHDFLTRVNGSYMQAVQGIKNLREIEPEIYICTNTTINRYNYMHLPEIAENNIRLGANACEFIFVHPRGNALKNFEEIVPTLREIEPFITKTIETGRRRGIDHFDFRYFPLCYVSKENLSEFKSIKKIKEHHIGPEFRDMNVEEGRKAIGRIKEEKCKKCKLYDECEGIFREYAERRGFEEFKPVMK